jgi:hypothetical protein
MPSIAKMSTIFCVLNTLFITPVFSYTNLVYQVKKDDNNNNNNNKNNNNNNNNNNLEKCLLLQK